VAEFTSLGCGIWGWDRFVALSYASRNLYLALYTCPNVKRTVPGLYHGGIASLAESARMPPDDLLASLNDLIDRGLAEWDRQHHVIRLTELPDGGERPSNGRHLRGLWNRFRTIPACGVRDAHVATLKVLLESGNVTEDHARAWEETFGTVVIPARRRRGARSALPEGAEQTGQGVLFRSADLGYPMPYPMAYPQDQDPEQDQDLDRVSDLVVTVPAPPPAAEQATTTPAPAPAPAPEHEVLAPVIALPVARPRVVAKPPLPFTIAELLDTLEEHSAGRFKTGVFDQRLAKPITDLIRQCDDQGVDLAGVAEVARWLASGALDWRKQVFGPSWVAASGKFFDALNQARAKPPPQVARRAAPPPPASFPGNGGRRKL
jgi:hypothetical protein